ncbi:hypothetical protein, partial [Porphyromonas sp.]|uniref:hypothetical protein n=1 Tax=Porphyromonas sp. TaxID=1924944 RepID=UPI003A911EAD
THPWGLAPRGGCFYTLRVALTTGNCVIPIALVTRPSPSYVEYALDLGEDEKLQRGNFKFPHWRYATSAKYLACGSFCSDESPYIVAVKLDKGTTTP